LLADQLRIREDGRKFKKKRRSLPQIITSKSGKINKELTKINLEDGILTSAQVMPNDFLEIFSIWRVVSRKVTGFEVIKLND